MVRWASRSLALFLSSWLALSVVTLRVPALEPRRRLCPVLPFSLSLDLLGRDGDVAFAVGSLDPVMLSNENAFESIGVYQREDAGGKRRELCQCS